MGILVGDVLHAHQMAGLLDVLENDLVGVPDFQAGKLLAGFLGEITAVVHRHHNGQLRIVLDTDFKVLDTVTRRGVDAAGAAFQSDMIAQDDQTGAVQEGMLVL